MTDLKALELAELQASIKTLQDELARRKAEEDEKQRELRRIRNLKFLAVKDTFLSFMVHGRTSCSDQDPCNGLYSGNGYPRCTKCALMELEEWNLDGVEISMEISIFLPPRNAR